MARYQTIDPEALDSNISQPFLGRGLTLTDGGGGVHSLIPMPYRPQSLPKPMLVIIRETMHPVRIAAAHLKEGVSRKSKQASNSGYPCNRSFVQGVISQTRHECLVPDADFLCCKMLF